MRGSSSFEFASRDGRPVKVYSYAADVDLTQAPIVVAMHGASRNAEGALNAWRPLADRYGLIVVAPELTEALYPGDSYNLGGTMEGASVSAVENWAFETVEELFDYVLAATASTRRGYTLYGHSAGAQFVERFALLWQSNRVEHFVAANAGWYTFLDGEVGYPYGLAGAPVAHGAAEAMLGSDLMVLIGELDTGATDLRTSTRANSQGLSRVERANNFYADARQTSTELGTPLGWRLVTVPNAAHDNGPMAEAAASLLFA